MYTISQGRRQRGGFSVMVHICTVDSFVEAVYLAQLAGGAMVTSASGRTHVGKYATHKPGGRFLRLQDVTCNAVMLVVGYLLATRLGGK